MICPRCGANNPDENRFCSACGAELPAPEERPEGPPTAPPAREKERKSWVWWLVVGLASCFGFLVIIGALLFAILFPVFSRAREKARTASCQSNLKQLALSVIMYTSDWHDKMPPANSWSDAIYPYIKNEGIFRCPSEPGRPGYAMNSNLNLLPMANVKSPAYTVLLFESTKGACNASDVGQSIAWRHSEGGNFAFVDGHVQWVHRGSPLNFDPTVASPPGITPAPIGPTTPLPP